MSLFTFMLFLFCCYVHFHCFFSFKHCTPRILFFLLSFSNWPSLKRWWGRWSSNKMRCNIGFWSLGEAEARSGGKRRERHDGDKKWQSTLMRRSSRSKNMPPLQQGNKPSSLSFRRSQAKQYQYLHCLPPSLPQLHNHHQPNNNSNSSQAMTLSSPLSLLQGNKKCWQGIQPWSLCPLGGQRRRCMHWSNYVLILSNSIRKGSGVCCGSR